jgi:hypothetical protein
VIAERPQQTFYRWGIAKYHEVGGRGVLRNRLE